jgi:putative membrane protein
MAAVLADQNILDKLGQDAVDELCGVLTASLHEAHPAEAICRTVTAAGEKLAPVLPRADDDVNELPNALVTLDD